MGHQRVAFDITGNNHYIETVGDAALAQHRGHYEKYKRNARPCPRYELPLRHFPAKEVAFFRGWRCCINAEIASIGQSWERRFCNACIGRGFVVISYAREKWSYDLTVNGHRVQCKRLDFREGVRNAVPITKGGTGSTKRYLISKVDFFAIESKGIVYIIPSAVLEDTKRKGECKKRARLNRLYDYVDAYFQFDDIPVTTPQKLLF